MEQKSLIEFGCNARFSFDNRRKFCWCLFHFHKELEHPIRATLRNIPLGINKANTFFNVNTLSWLRPSNHQKCLSQPYQTLALFSNFSFGRKSFAFYFSVFFPHHCALELRRAKYQSPWHNRDHKVLKAFFGFLFRFSGHISRPEKSCNLRM